MPPAVEARSINHWTAREVPIIGIGQYTSGRRAGAVKFGKGSRGVREKGSCSGLWAQVDKPERERGGSQAHPLLARDPEGLASTSREGRALLLAVASELQRSIWWWVWGRSEQPAVGKSWE